MTALTRCSPCHGKTPWIRCWVMNASLACCRELRPCCGCIWGRVMAQSRLFRSTFPYTYFGEVVATKHPRHEARAEPIDSGWKCGANMEHRGWLGCEGVTALLKTASTVAAHNVSEMDITLRNQSLMRSYVGSNRCEWRWRLGTFVTRVRQPSVITDMTMVQGKERGQNCRVILSQTYGTQLLGCHRCQPVPDVQMARDEGTFFEVVWVSRWNP